MIEGSKTQDAATAIDAASEQLATALKTLREARKAAHDVAFQNGGPHRAQNDVGNVIGGDILAIEIVKRMKAAGLAELFQAAERSGGIDVLPPLESLSDKWSTRLAGLLRPFVDWNS